MPEYLRALAAILLLSLAVFALAQGPACAAAMEPADFRRRRNLWLALTLIAFLSRDFWLFMMLSAGILFFFGYRESNKPALFLFLLFAIPDFGDAISGLGLAAQLFTLTFPRLLSLTLLLPAAVLLFLHPPQASPAGKWPERALALYLGLTLAQQLAVDTVTNTLRYGLYDLLDIVLPYYVASRSLQSRQAFRDTLMSFAVAAMVLAATAVFEFVKGWLLYASLDEALGINWIYGAYLSRGASLRALATTGQPIALGFVLAVACGLFLYLRPAVPRRTDWLLGLGLLGAGLIAALSRGPWLGAALGGLVFLATGPKPVENIAKLAFVGLVVTPIVLVTPLGDTILEHLPYIGTADSDSFVYRQRLLQASLEVIRLHPFFGSFDYLAYLEDLRQGQGIIDVVNTYLGIALSSGLVGLGLFLFIFLSILAKVFRTLQACPASDDELRLLGRVLFATHASILVIIFSVSSITVIPIVYWSVAGLGIAFARLQESQAAARATPRQRSLGMMPGPTVRLDT